MKEKENGISKKRIPAGEYIVAQNKWILRERFNHIFLKIFTDQ